MNKQVIRKLVLQELLAQIDKRQRIDEVAPVVVAAGAVVAVAALTALEEFAGDTSQFHRELLSGKVYNSQKEFLKSLENPQILHVSSIDQTRGGKIAKELFDAMIGEGLISQTLDMIGSPVGTGTDEEDVQKAIEKCKSQLALSKVSYFYSDVIYPDRNLVKDIDSEFGPIYLERYVTRPINALPFAIFDGRGITREEYEELLKEAAGKSPGSSAGSGGAAGFPSSVKPPFIRNIIIVMNKYAEEKELSGYKKVSGSVWNESVQASWLIFARHVLENCNLYTDFKDIPVDSWPSMSEAMSGKYPGYTGDPKGCLAFALDGYHCELRHGGKGKPDLDREDKSQRSGGGEAITMQVTSGAETVSLSDVWGAAVQRDLIRELENNFKENIQRTAVRKSTMQIDLTFDRGFDRVKRVRRRKEAGGSSRQNFKGNIARTVGEFFNKARVKSAGKKKLKKFSDGRKMRIIIDIPANYRSRG
jgi:hypothetical protein